MFKDSSKLHKQSIFSNFSWNFMHVLINPRYDLWPYYVGGCFLNRWHLWSVTALLSGDNKYDKHFLHYQQKMEKSCYLITFFNIIWKVISFFSDMRLVVVNICLTFPVSRFTKLKIACTLKSTPLNSTGGRGSHISKSHNENCSNFQ